MALPEAAPALQARERVVVSRQPALDGAGYARQQLGQHEPQAEHEVLNKKDEQHLARGAQLPAAEERLEGVPCKKSLARRAGEFGRVCGER